MIDLPDFSKAWEHELGFYLSCDPSRLGKLAAHYELFRMTAGLAGALVECGVFKGASLTRFAMWRELFGTAAAHPIVGFDTFGAFPGSTFAPDAPHIERFVRDAGNQSISVSQLRDVLARKRIDAFVDLVDGDILETVPRYVKEHPELRIALLNLDTDIYEPSAVVLEHLYPRLVPGGVLVLDDYGTFPGETKAVDEYFAGRRVRIEKFPFAMTPCFIRKELT